MSIQKQVASTLFAAWLAENHPDVFQELSVRATNPADGRVNVTLAPPNLAGFTDTLSSIWGGVTSAASKVASGLGTAVKSVGSFLGSQAGQDVLATAVALKYGSASQQASIIATQNQRANANQTPAPIQTILDPSTGTYVPVLNQQQNTSTGVTTYQYPISNQILTQLQPDFFSKYQTWIIGGAIGVVLLIVLTRRRG